MVEYLLRQLQCDPNPIDRFGRTPLEVLASPVTPALLQTCNEGHISEQHAHQALRGQIFALGSAFT